MRRPHNGFTLVEMAFVLIIISLILGGAIVAGNAIFERSRVASLLSKIKDVGVAARDFKTRYGYFPGDFPNAGTYITANGGIIPACNYAGGGGVGNGLVDAEVESSCAFEHLVQAGLLSKVERGQAGNYVVNSGFGAGQVSLWFDRTTNENMIRVTSLPCSIALELDRKLDNDSPTPLSAAGIVRGTDASGNPVQTCVVKGANDPVVLLVKY